MRRLRLMPTVVWLVFATILATSSCLGLQDVRDHCLEAPDNCPPCQLDNECVIVSNPCHETAHCTHRDTHLSVNQIGCNLEYDVPSDDVCRCVEGLCRSSW